MRCLRLPLRLYACLVLTSLLVTTASAEDLVQIGKSIRASDAPANLLVAPDGQSVLVRSGKVCRLVDPMTGMDIGKPLELSTGNVTFGYGDDGKFLYAFTTSLPAQEVRVWKASTAESMGPVVKVEKYNLGMRPLLTTDGRNLVVFSGKSSGRVIDVATGKQQGNLFDIGQGANRAIITPEGRIAAFVTDVGYRLFDIQSGRAVGEKLAPPEGRTLTASPFEQRTELRFSSDGKYLFALVNPAKARPTTAPVRAADMAMWDAATGKPLAFTFPYSPHACGSWDVSADGKWIALGGEERTCNIFNVMTGEKVHTVKHDLPASRYGALLTAVCFSPDGTQVVTSCVGEPMGRRDAPLGDVRLWDVATGAQVGKTITFRNPVYQFAFTPDGKNVIIGSTARDPRVELRGGITGAFLIGDPKSNEASVWKVPARSPSPSPTPTPTPTPSPSPGEKPK